MRLLNAKTKKLEEFFEKDIPPYAILSHAWGKDEVLFKDVMKGRYNNDSDKIEGCCREALDNDLNYVWIDTCCIDKRSSAELSEAINSMFHWYKQAAVCYAYLADVGGTFYSDDPRSTLAFRKSRWWTRGWTLQELLAPERVVFYSASWYHLGEKLHSPSSNSSFSRSINSLITEITGIENKYLNSYDNSYNASVAEKMSWAALRQTTRVEDVAYSLLGIFDVNMPLLYGEGPRAFLRLQEAIISSTNDQSIFAWKSRQVETLLSNGRLLASSPSVFGGCGKIVSYTPDWADISHYSITNAGLQVPMRLRKLPGSDGAFIGLLNCATRENEGSRNIAITLVRYPENTEKITMAGPFIRCCKRPMSISLSIFQQPDNDLAIPIYIRSGHVAKNESGLIFKTSAGTKRNFIEALEVYPPAWQTIVDEGYHSDFNGTFHSRDMDVEIQRQETIHIRCLMRRGEEFVVCLKYGFTLPRYKSWLIPRTLEISVAELRDGQSLAEIMVEHEGQLDKALHWQKQFDLNPRTLTFRVQKEGQEGPLPDSWIVHPTLSD